MSAQPNKTTSKEFHVHPAMIYSLITKQASGAPKALLELIMNSVDAGATRIDIKMDSKGYEIADNGHGFKDAEQITSFFGTFGTPHEDGDAFYGRFRLGRAQSFGISRTKWFSKSFCMEVDLKVELEQDDKEVSLGYAVSEGHPFYNGCRIVGEFYNEQKVGAVKDFFTASIGERPEQMPIIPALIKMIRYIPCDVYINNEKVNISLAESAVSHAIESAHFMLDKTKGLNIVNVYNKGVYAYQLTSNYHSGDVVSIEALDLNIARNEAKHTCAVAKKIRNKLKALDLSIDNIDSTKKSKREKAVDQTVFVDGLWQIMLGQKEFDKEIFEGMADRKIFSLANDKKMSLRQVVSVLNKQRGLLDGVEGSEFLVYENDALDLSGNELDLMSIENGYLPLSLFPSQAVLTKLNYLVETFPANCVGSRDPDDLIAKATEVNAEYLKHHCFDFSKTESLEEKYRLLLAVLFSSFFAIESGFCIGEKFCFYPYLYKCYRVRFKPLTNLNFTVINVDSLSQSAIADRVSKLVEHNVKLNDFEKMVIASIGHNVSLGLFGVKRELCVVSTAENIQAYTDGKSRISFNHSFLKACINKGDFEEFLRVFIHEQAHNSSSLGKASHGATFYAEYTRLLSVGFMQVLNDFYDLLGQKIESHVNAKGVNWLKQQVPVPVIAKIAKYRFNNRVRAFG